LKVSDFDDPQLYSALARKMAHIHSLNVPIQKDPNLVFNNYANLIKKSLEEPLLLEEWSDSEREQVSGFLAMDLMADLDWIRNQVPKIKSRVVFSHNDYHSNNLLLRDEDETGVNSGLPYGDRLVVIDVEMCAYFYRGLDFGTHFRFVSVDLSDNNNQPRFGPISEERNRYFIREYLKEYRERNPETFDPEIDNEEAILRESELFQQLRAMTWILKTRKIMKTGSVQFPRKTIVEWISYIFEKGKEAKTKLREMFGE
jgi:choline/ethanolamine kinase